MSHDLIMVGSTLRIPLLYWGEYSQWCERFMNYLEEQTYGEAMIHFVTYGEQALPVVIQVSLAGTAPNAPLIFKEPELLSAKEKQIQRIDRLARSLLI
ncbi:hypothetical protein Tco_0299832 [Tanacetum coccineum]